MLVGTEHERRTRRPRPSKDYLRGDAGSWRVYVHGEGFLRRPRHRAAPGPNGRRMNTTLQEIGLDGMPQQNNRTPVAEPPLERSAS